MAVAAKRREPLLKKGDFSTHLEAKARETAPRDVEILLADAGDARERAAAVSPRMGQQMELALSLLSDHIAGECPQIPFYTVSLLAEAVFYVLDPNDVIPDWIPGIGKLDDALVLELAFEHGAAGISRYCAFKGIDPASLANASPHSPAKRSQSSSVQPTRGKAAGKKTLRRKPAPKQPAPPAKKTATKARAAKRSTKKRRSR